jgi:hypothetical protein
MWWRVFDHVSFAMICFGVVFGFALGASLEELLVFFLTGFFWTAWHSRSFSRKPDYKMGVTAKRFATVFYALTLIGALYLIFAPADWKI